MKTTTTKMFYTIKEVASLLGEPEHTLRFWETEFQDVISPKRNDRGVRFYTQKDMDDVRMIQYFRRDCGLTTEGVRKRLKNNKEVAIRQAKIAKHLHKMKKELLEFREALDAVDKQKVQFNVYAK